MAPILPSPRTTPDRFGVLASGICLVHCALLAFAPAALAGAGLGVWVSHELEWGLTGFAVLFALTAAFLGYRSHGGQRMFAVLIGCALVLIFARILETLGLHEFGAIIGVLAGLGLVTGHLLNLKANRQAS